jgi:uncharacterized membrane protein
MLQYKKCFSLEEKESIVSTQPNQGKKSDQDSYDGYAGYQPRKPADDPYGAYYRPSDSQQSGAAEAEKQQSDPNYVYGQKQHSQTYRSSSTSKGQQQQQGSTYQPPSSVTGKRYGSSGQASTKLEPRKAAALSYLGLCFTGLFFFLRERQNRLVRFSAAQSIALFLPLLVIYGILQFVIGIIGHIWIIGPLLAGFLGTAIFFVIVVPAFLVWLFLMFQAYRGIEVKLPFVGEYAERLLGLFSPKQRKGRN